MDIARTVQGSRAIALYAFDSPKSPESSTSSRGRTKAEHDGDKPSKPSTPFSRGKSRAGRTSTSTTSSSTTPAPTSSGNDDSAAEPKPGGLLKLDIPHTTGLDNWISFGALGSTARPDEMSGPAHILTRTAPAVVTTTTPTSATKSATSPANTHRLSTLFTSGRCNSLPSRIDFLNSPTSPISPTSVPPTLPDLNVPLTLDFAAELERSLSIGSKIEPLRGVALKETVVTIKDAEPETPPAASAPVAPAVVPVSTTEPTRTKTTTTTTTTTTLTAPIIPPKSPAREPLPRRKSMIDRPRSWMPGSTTTVIYDARETAEDRRTRKLSKPNHAGGAREVAQEVQRPKTASVESFADYAKRSWISTSRSPSPPTKKLERQSPAEGRRTSRGLLGLGSKKEKTAGGVSGSGATAAGGDAPQESSRSRALQRASTFVARMKQRPQSVFSKSSSSTSVSASSVNSSKSSDIDSSASSSIDNSSASGVKPVDQSTTSSTTTTTKLLQAKDAKHDVSSSNSDAPSTTRNSSLDTTVTAATSENASQSTAETSITMPNPSSGDPLWSTFRTLDSEFSKFVAKNSTPMRMNVVRSTLVPFLRSTSHHPSNSNTKQLSPEDFDRRATILNKWWNGLLDMLDAGQSRLERNAFAVSMGTGSAMSPPPTLGTNLQPVAGIDRPILLETITIIMMRPEWRSCTSSFQPLSKRSPEERVRARSSTQSTADETELAAIDFVAQSAEHNVRTMFVNSLTRQMALVVDKLSLRHAPLSLVNWSGKACAYAFFFVPGIADVLVRLWQLNSDLLRRTSDEFKLPRRSKGESEDIVALFPPHLGKLGWTSVKTLGNRLRLAAKLPLNQAKIAWHGPWVSRWRGGDTDLFYVFCKYYHILSADFMPEGLPLVEKARAPAFVLVHAQLLSTLDGAIHRQASMDALLGPPIADSLHGTDATMTGATGLSLPSNVLKGMDENRLVALLKDMLSEKSVVGSEIRHNFAESFMAVMVAATKRTSRYEHAACFMLCDFLQEALTALNTYQDSQNNSVATSPIQETMPTSAFDTSSSLVNYIDWPFWFEVGKMIMDSNNTMSEIRIISFIYSVWDAIVADPARKEKLCCEWLLTEETFERFFNHWCPMVRAYYMRLLCWRVCRDTGSVNELDNKIFLLVAQRLRTVWSHYLWMWQTAEAEGRIPPSTAPCLPTPGKRFLIIRSEVQPAQTPLYLGFDSFTSSFPGIDGPSDYQFTSNENRSSVRVEETSKKRWSLLGKVLNFTASQAQPSNSATNGKRTWDEELEQARRETAAAAAARAGPPPPPKQNSSMNAKPSSDSASSTGSAPVYDVATFVFRFALTWQGTNGLVGPQRDMVLYRPRLPAPAQSRVLTRAIVSDGSPNGEIYSSPGSHLIRPGLPPVTRRYSGQSETGLINHVRNARPLSIDTSPPPPERNPNRRRSTSINLAILHGVGESDDKSALVKTRSAASMQDSSPFSRACSPPPAGFDSEVNRLNLAVRAQKPVGIYASGAVYSGRALAEWSLVVSECNSFMDRRRDEGVLGLRDVEVPNLGVEGMGLKRGG
ncbi:hypothetical protein SMACR_04896 [Sordaria macrospora]|uniref:WGS project CABT00000000 data, contig 2.1 n=2 Tax=Sordaria macrospora TaxID=5147 RepID=F7VLX5_SORMK|nr:uncharacterized protein SMAC_04896 [Sordaria macrospora k-hell]KAA8623985.1 hypothetical protein SMACR_04896 [Sordaria macrospora]WPJ59471.1 hypothetical protein SMAC4_04896 [Sordaria macrospora]CCC06503.1 unnamed protein product [Sordaria macrospora k-hell]